ncbi:hypothetical protein D3C78_1043820 [compost metagenome]
MAMFTGKIITATGSITIIKMADGVRLALLVVLKISEYHLMKTGSDRLLKQQMKDKKISQVKLHSSDLPHKNTRIFRSGLPVIQ